MKTNSYYAALANKAISQMKNGQVAEYLKTLLDIQRLRMEFANNNRPNQLV